MKKLVLIFGDNHTEQESIPLKIMENIRGKLPDVEFRILNKPEEIAFLGEKKLYIMDILKGIKEVTLIENFDSVEPGHLVTIHGHDLGFFLKLMKTSGTIPSIRIIGLPSWAKEYLDDYQKEIIDILR